MIVGLDLSSFTIAGGVINDKELVSFEILANKKDNFDLRFDDLTKKFYSLFLELRPSAVYIEAIPYVKSARTALTLTSVLGMVRAICCLLDIPYYVVNNMTWKKQIGLKGRVSKDQTKELVTALYNINETLSENQYDAIGVATHGYYSLHPEIVQRGEIRYSGNVPTEPSTEEDASKNPVSTEQEIVQTDAQSTA